MPSQPRIELDRRLADFEELMRARDAVCPSNPGRPAERQGAAIIRSSVVMLSAAFEAYVEELFDEAADLIFASAAKSDLNELKKDTSEKLNNASTFKVNRLFFNLGIPWIMQHPRVRWQKFSNQSVQEELNRIIKARNSIAHGGNKSVHKATALKWKGVIQKLSDRLDLLVAEHVENQNGTRPW